MSLKILLLEDDEILNEVIAAFLVQQGYEVVCAYDGEEAESLAYENHFDLLLFDVNVPLLDGFALLQSLRQKNITTPAIYITSFNETQDLQKGFQSGCDDYIKKPFEFEELRLRIENIRIIQAQMSASKLQLADIQISDQVRYGLFDEDKKPLFSNIDLDIDFTQQVFYTANSLFYVSDAPLGHLGIYFVVIQADVWHEKLALLRENILLLTLASYIFIAFIGTMLAKLFIVPIQSQRAKLNRFIKDTTHELNTPLSALMLCADAKDFQSPANKERIKISAKKISNLYKDLTYLLHKDQQHKEIRSQDISKIIVVELMYFEQIAKWKQITIAQNIQNTQVCIDAEDFRRLITNLLCNAIKYTQRKGSIEVSLQEKILQVKDNGIGIEEDKLNAIFKRYVRADDSIGGFGIGLDIVNTIALYYNIKIQVHSTPKKGSTFILDFKNTIQFSDKKGKLCK